MALTHRTLGRTGLKVSEIGFGCGTTAGLMISGTPEARRAAVAKALELGINYFDTAPVYGNTASEAHLGQALRELGANPIVATKVALEVKDLDDIGGAVRRSVEASLARLGLDHLALVQLHNRVGGRRAVKSAFGTGALLSVDDVLGPEGVVEALSRLRARGLIRYFGCSAYGGAMSAVCRLIDSGAFDTMIVSYSALNPTAWNAAAIRSGLTDYDAMGAHAAAAGMGTIALRVLEGGILAGSREPQGARLGPDHATMVARRETLQAKLAHDDPTIPELAIRFALSNRAISTVLVGFSTIAQIEDSIRYATAGPLSPEHLKRIEKLHETGG